MVCPAGAFIALSGFIAIAILYTRALQGQSVHLAATINTFKVNGA
jgi:hypothetical protein